MATSVAPWCGARRGGREGQHGARAGRRPPRNGCAAPRVPRPGSGRGGSRPGAWRASSCPSPVRPPTAGGAHPRPRSQGRGGPPTDRGRRGGRARQDPEPLGLRSRHRSTPLDPATRRQPGPRSTPVEPALPPPRPLRPTRPRAPRCGRASIEATKDAMPGTGRSDPSSPSSPTNPVCSTHWFGSTSAATSNPMAMGRSSPAPVLRTPDGAKLTVTRRDGHDRWLDSSAARTRSRDSRTAASGSPTNVKPGNPAETWTSTETGRPSTPCRVAEGIRCEHGGAPGYGDTRFPCRFDRSGPPEAHRPREVLSGA